MIQVYLKLINIFIFTSLLLSSCHLSTDNKIIETYSNEIRSKFKNKLKSLPKVNYFKILGRIPSKDEVELGRQLFADPILSRNNDVSCATCHLSNHGFGDGNSLNVGALGKGGPNGNNVGKSFGEGKISISRSLGTDGNGFHGNSFMFRNSPSTLNVAFRVNKNADRGLFWDGRFGNLTFQVLLPIHTGIEMCGRNPVTSQNIFKPGGIYFKKKVHLSHVNSFDGYTGKDTGNFYATPQDINGVPTFRPNGSMSIPGRNECLAIAIAKLRNIPKYVQLFKKIYKSEIKDNLLASAITSYVSTHVSKNAPYDQFVKGKNNLSLSELKGMVSFFTPIGKTTTILKNKIRGAGCFSCHNGPIFGGQLYNTLGVKTDKRSPLTKSQNISSKGGSFFGKNRLIRGFFPRCYIKDVSVGADGYVPDMGAAGATFDEKDCFKFRVPPLRNVLETYPYFHSGTANGKDNKLEGLTLKEKAILGLKQVLRYHLNGPVDVRNFSMNKLTLKSYFDETFQRDFLVPHSMINMYNAQNEKFKTLNNSIFPIRLKDDIFLGLIDFLSISLNDDKATQIGDLGNDISHPTSVPSGFLPTITRDSGNQLEIAPNSKIK